MAGILNFFKPYIPFVILIIGFLFGQAMCELALPGYMSDIINKGIIGGDMSYIYHQGGFMLLVSACSVFCAITTGFLAARTASMASRDARSSLFRKITGFSKHEFDKFQSASLITRTTNDIQTVQQSSIMVLRMAFYAPLLGIGALIRALRTSPALTWTIALSLGLIFIVMIVMFFTVMPKFKVMQKKLDRLNQIVGERLSGLLVVRAFTTEPYEEDRFEKANRELMKIGVFTNRAMSLMFPVLTLIMNFSGILIVWAGSDLINSHNLMVGDMLAFLQYSMQILFSFLVITMIFIMIPRAMVSAERITEVIKEEQVINDPQNPVSTTPANRNASTENIDGAIDGAIASANVNSNVSDINKNISEQDNNKAIDVVSSKQGTVQFHNVDFSYDDASENTLENISFTAKPGQVTALIGSTGSGKSTIINLIPRFFDVSSGKVTIDGVDVRDITQAQLRDRIGLVPQKGLLFSGTIKSNLQFGKKDATDEEIEQALKIAQAWDFVCEMPDKLDTPVSQGGTSVSGGQKQRLSIARALIKKPDIYIFDDSFSALDFATDKKLRQALKDEVGDSTFILVAQRINTIIDADQIIVMDDGKISGIGTHQELLANNHIYREIALSQLSSKELGDSLEGGVDNEI